MRLPGEEDSGREPASGIEARALMGPCTSWEGPHWLYEL